MAKGDNDSFVVGNKVLRKNIREDQRKDVKLEAEWLGPYVICNIEGKSVDLKSGKGTAVSKINICHLKKYVEPEERIPANWFASTTQMLQHSPLRSFSIGVPSDTLTFQSRNVPASSEECKYTVDVNTR